VNDADVLLRLVRPYSPFGREAAAVRAFVRVARALGYSARIDAAGNGIARRGRGHPSLLYLGHIDTVEGRLPVRRSQGRIRGRGTVDAKGPLAAALLAGRRAPPNAEFVVVAAVEEELDSRGARHLVGRAPPDAVIAGEPSGWDGITVGYKGELQVEATFRGPRTHFASAQPTAADRAVAWIGAVRTLAGDLSASSPFRTLTSKVARWDADVDAGREVARVTVDFRLPPGRTTGELFRALPRDGAPSSIAPRIRMEPLEVDPSNPVVRSLIRGIRGAGGRPTVWRKTGTSDLNLVVPAWNVPGAAYGPGEAKLDHTDRESISLADLGRSVEVLESALGELLGPESTLRRSVGGA
jgi:[amino group carrier protein]-lysine/ornithine hydrolase